MLPRMARQPDGGRSQGAVRVGTASWTDPTLLKSGWYPKGANDAESRLRFYATQFPIVEVDATYYYLPREEQAGLWVDHTQLRLRLQHQGVQPPHRPSTPSKALPEDLLDEVTPEHRDKERFYASHLSADGRAQIWRRFRNTLLPLDSAGKLGAVLLQYPQSFAPAPLRPARSSRPSATASTATRSVSSSATQPGWPPTATATAPLGLLRDHDLPLVSVGHLYPQGFRSSVPPIAEAHLPPPSRSSASTAATPRPGRRRTVTRTPPLPLHREGTGRMGPQGRPPGRRRPRGPHTS